MAATPKSITILGSNETSYHLLQRLHESLNIDSICMIQDSDSYYCPSAFYPDLLSGHLTLKDVGLLGSRKYNDRISFRTDLPEPEHLKRSIIINTHPDPLHISLIRFPSGHQRCIPLYNTDSIANASNRLAEHQKLVIYGSSIRAILYADAAARAGYKTVLVTDPDDLIHRGFDGTTNSLIHQNLEIAGITLIKPENADKCLAEMPVLYTPFHGRSPAISRARQRLKRTWQSLPKSRHQLQDGGDWYQLPSRILEQMVGKIGQDFSTRETPNLCGILTNRSELPHRFCINNLVVHYAGILKSERQEDCITMSVPECGIYRKIILAGNHIAGFLLAGDVSGSERLADMMLTHRNINDCRDELIFTGR